MDSVFAQTRIASSYGIMQLMYTESGKDNYPQDIIRRPEDISDHRIGLQYGIHHLFRGLKSVLKDKLAQIDSNDWSDGIEGVYRAALHLFNARKDYPDAIIANAANYLPRKVAP